MSTHRANEDIRLETREAMTIVGMRRRFDDGSMAGAAAMWQAFGPRIGSIPGEKSGSAYGVIEIDAAGAVFYTCGVETKDRADAPEGLSVVAIPAHRYAIFWHRDNVGTVQKTAHAIFGRILPEAGLKAVASPRLIERYTAAFDPRTGNGGFEILVPIRN